MAQDYATFKTWLQTFLWKSNDTVVANNLDNLIKMANSEMRRKLDINERKQSQQVTMTGNNFSGNLLDVNTYDTIHSVIDLNPPSGSGDAVTFTAKPLSYIYELRAKYAGKWYPYYATESYTDDTADPNSRIPEFFIRFPDNYSFNAQGTLQIVWRRGIPDYQVLDYSWVEDKFLDYYTYTVLAHSAPFLKQDERIPVWKEMRDDALASILEDDKHNIELGGSPIGMLPHRTVP